MESFIRTATRIGSMNELQVVEHYGEVSRVLRHVRPLSADQVAERIIQLYKRHAFEVTGVIDSAHSAHVADIREEKLPATCAILLAIPDSYKRVAAAEGQDSPVAPVDLLTAANHEGTPPQTLGDERWREDVQQSVPHLRPIKIPAWLRTVERSEEANQNLQSLPTKGSMDRAEQTDPIWSMTSHQQGPVRITRLNGEVVCIDPTAPQEPNDAVLTSEDEQRIAEVTLGGRSELRSELEKLFGGPDWPQASVIIEPFKRYATKIFDVNAAAHRNITSTRARDSHEILNAMRRNLLSEVFGREWESSPGERVTRTDWQHGIEGWKGMEMVVIAGNDPDPTCLYHELISDAIKYRYRFHAVLPSPIPGEPPGINLSNVDWFQYIGLNERHNLAMAVKPYLEDRVAHWRLTFGLSLPAEGQAQAGDREDTSGAARSDLSKQPTQPRSGAEMSSPTTVGARREDTNDRPSKARKGDAALLGQKRLVSFSKAEQYLGISDRQRQKLISSGALRVEGQGQNRKITAESLTTYLPPETPN